MWYVEVIDPAKGFGRTRPAVGGKANDALLSVLPAKTFKNLVKTRQVYTMVSRL